MNAITQTNAPSDALIQIARDIEAMKRECGMDPESATAIYNGRLMGIAYRVRSLASAPAQPALTGAHHIDGAFHPVMPAYRAPDAAEHASGQLSAIYAAFGIGNEARSLSVLMANIENARRRSDCLWAVEHAFFMVPTEPEEEDDGVPGEECLLNWGHDPVEYVASFREALAALASQSTPPAIDLQSIEQYYMQMAGIGTAALGYWKEGDPIHPDYDTSTLREVAKLYAKYDALYKQANTAAPATAQGAGEPKHPDTLRCIEARNKLNAAAHGEGSLIDSLEESVDRVCRDTLDAESTGQGLSDAQIDAAAKVLAERMDYPWQHMPEQGRKSMRDHATAVIEASRASQPKEQA